VRHFDKYVSRQSTTDVSVLRVYDPDRRSSTVSDVVKRYCLMSSDSAAAASFVSPTRNDLVRHKIIVTTLVTSLLLTKLSVKGHFTHIFIDEAAQVRLLTYFTLLINFVYYFALVHLSLIQKWSDGFQCKCCQQVYSVCRSVYVCRSMYVCRSTSVMH